jgi:hypothetical protein
MVSTNVSNEPAASIFRVYTPKVRDLNGKWTCFSTIPHKTFLYSLFYLDYSNSLLTNWKDLRPAVEKNVYQVLKWTPGTVNNRKKMKWTCTGLDNSDVHTCSTNFWFISIQNYGARSAQHLLDLPKFPWDFSVSFTATHPYLYVYCAYLYTVTQE